MTTPESFTRQLVARMRAPTLLDPSAVESVLSLSFDAITEDDAGAYFGDAEGSYDVDDDGIATMRVEGALAQRAWACFIFGGDGYDAVESRVRAAMGDRRTRALVMIFDSPGGEVAGCGVCASTIRAIGDATGKPIVAYVGELAASAAYWLASAADRVVLPPSAIAGSIGVIASRIEETERPVGENRRVHIFTSGARKADGYPMLAMSDEERAAIQERVDTLADVFAGAVAERRGMTLEAVRGLEAGVFVGQKAVDAGLADQVTDLPGAIALAASLAASTTTTGQQPMKTLLAAMGLEASASEAEAVAKYTTEKSSAGDQVSRVLTALGAKNIDEAVAKAVAYKRDAEETATLRAKIAEEAKIASVRERAAALDAAVEAGLMSPAERADYEANPVLASLGADAIKAAMKHRTPVARAPIAGGPAPTADALTDREREIAKSIGLTEDDIKTERAAERAGRN